MSLIFAMVGTDHHPFHRLVDWMDEAARRHPDTRFVVQHGESKAPILAEGHAYLPHAQISELLAEADGAVVHGGPGTIMDARAAGHVPICVPRDPALGEHVDGHQQRFAALVGPAGVVTHVQSADRFHAAVEAALAGRVGWAGQLDARERGHRGGEGAARRRAGRAARSTPAGSSVGRPPLPSRWAQRGVIGSMPNFGGAPPTPLRRRKSGASIAVGSAESFRRLQTGDRSA